MANINKAAVLNPFTDLTALTPEGNNLNPNLINEIAATQTDLIKRADQLAEDVTTKLPLTGGTLSGQLAAPNILINRSDVAASGISWYGWGYSSWQDYLAHPGLPGNGVNGNITAPTGTYVNAWARRSVIAPVAGCGWTFETVADNGTAPSIVAELDINGTFKTAGDIHGANLTVSGDYGAGGLVRGNGDAASYDYCNIDITSWSGLGIKSSQSSGRTVVFDTRNGDISNKGSIHTEGVVNARALGINNTAGTGAGLSLYEGADGGMPNYGISFALTSHYGQHGYVTSDWATYFTMSGAHDRGWIFRSSDYGNVASISAQGNAYFNGSIVAGGIITSVSDARLKDNITKIPDALNKLNQLKGVTYTRKDLTTDTQYAGLNAQDVQKVLPEAVVVTADDIITVDYNGIIGLLVEAIKELETKVAILEGR